MSFYKNRRLLALAFAAVVFFAILPFGAQVNFEAKAETSPEQLSIAGETKGMIPGEYFGIGQGRNGPIVVKVSVSEEKIERIEVISQNETHNTGSVPAEIYPKLIVDNQSLAIDIVSGATISSAALLTAVRNAVQSAGGDLDKFNNKINNEAKAVNDEADVVVVGAGGAGMTAAVFAAKAGKRVILLEKLGVVGGTSNYSIEGFGSVGDKTHNGLGSDVTAETLAANLLQGNPKGTEESFKILANNNGIAADWLRSIGAPMTVAAGQTSVATSREVGELGCSIIAALYQECLKNGVDVRINSRAIEVLAEGGKAAGVKVSSNSGSYDIMARAVVLATGGFGANNELVSEHYPALKGYDSSCSVGATGDGHLMAQALGAELLNMDYIRVNFTYTTAPNKYFYYMGSLFNTGAILVNDAGNRFVNDQGAYGVGLKVVDQGGSAWAIFDQSLIEGVRDVREYGKLGLYQSANSIEELADLIGVNKENLVATIDRYKGFVANGKDEEFGRAMLNMTFDEAPYYACRMTARVQGTFGGISTNEKTQVLTAEGAVIPGLYSAGECANDGTWGANPAAVNIVFGRIAGENAAAYAGND